MFNQPDLIVPYFNTALIIKDFTCLHKQILLLLFELKSTDIHVSNAVSVQNYILLRAATRIDTL